MKCVNPRLATYFKKKAKRSKPGTVLTQKKTIGVNKSWVLLDRKSTIDMFCSPSLLIKIWISPDKLRLLCNAVTYFTNQVGDLEGYITVWFYSEDIENRISLYRNKNISRHI